MIWLITYLFFVIGPCQTIGDGYIGKTAGPVAGISFTDAELAQTALLIFLFFLTVTITKFFFKPKIPRTFNLVLSAAHTGPLIMLNILAFAAFVIFSGGISNVLASRADKLRDEISTIATAFLALQIVSAILTTTIYRTSPASRLAAPATLLVLTLLLVSQNPYNSARYYLLAAWLPIIFIWFGGRIRAVACYGGVFFAIVFLMPVLSLTSRFGRDLSRALENIDLKEAFFHLPYIDVFDMLAYEVKYLASADFLWGEKTLGLLLFFVPRSIWPGKATLLAVDMGTGLTDAKIAGTPNLSLFFAGEFYADFGLIGVVLGAFSVTFLLIRLGSMRRPLVNGLNLRALVFIAATPILMRGPFGANAPLSLMEFLCLAGLTSVFCSKREMPKLSSRSAIDVRSVRQSGLSE
ncbi:hypothetical protein [Bradyrhizobium sp. CCBAU 11430]|uniref:hypothetical protein n=1 Tax=Bradyrhizobium sp. CCBAU 11430 TaxID=1630881 RepID=UPI002304FE1F|nr:hypothetical protein [Bradyrhizobium sp. CCBAU 11430]